LSLLKLFNQYSAFITITGIIVLMIALLPIKGRRRQISVYLVAVIIRISAVMVLRPGTSSVGSEFEAQV
jgi:hypothetical protein